MFGNNAYLCIVRTKVLATPLSAGSKALQILLHLNKRLHHVWCVFFIAINSLQIVHHVCPFLPENEIGSSTVPWVRQKIYGVTMLYGFVGSIQQCIEIAIILAANRIDCRLSFYESESSILGNLLQLLDELDAR